jgi:plastocyanin
MNKLYLAIAIIIIGAVAGWYAFGSGGAGKVNLPKISDLAGKTKAGPTPTPYETENSNLYDYIEDNAVKTAGSSSATGSKGGLNIVQSQPATASGQILIEYTDSGFRPQVVTVKVNTKIKFINSSTSRELWVASNDHPTHQILPSLDQKQAVARGGSYEYVFDKIGTWVYHNHLYPNQTGTVVVKR